MAYVPLAPYPTTTADIANWSQHSFLNAAPDSFSAHSNTPKIRLGMQNDNYLLFVVLFFQSHTLILALLILCWAADQSHPLNPSFPLYPAWKVFQQAELTCVYQGRGGGRGKGSPSTGFLAGKRKKHNPDISKKEKTKRGFFPHPVLFMKSLHPPSSMY